mmetsp:Transcript_6631/g.12793  ORF Transcript_6631/g.12793 Transcript_6631/m.12793 type:complete len:108 (-) Transcript_6631:215-538(-)
MLPMSALWTGSGYDLKIRYSNMSDSTPNAEAIAEQELRYLEPNKKITPGTGGGAGEVVQWGMDRFKPGGKHGRGHGKGRGHGRGKGKGAGKMKKRSSSVKEVFASSR